MKPAHGSAAAKQLAPRDRTGGGRSFIPPQPFEAAVQECRGARTEQPFAAPRATRSITLGADTRGEEQTFAAQKAMSRTGSKLNLYYSFRKF